MIFFFLDIKDEFSCEAFFLYGVYLKLRGKNSEAEKMIMMALEIKPTYNEALIEAGNLHSMSLEDCESSTQLELGMSFFKKVIKFSQTIIMIIRIYPDHPKLS